MSLIDNSRPDMNKLRKTIMNAQDEKVISAEEAGFIVTIANRFRADIEKKTRAMYALQGEIAQLRTNEQVIIELVNNLVGAQRRADDRAKTLHDMKQAKKEAQDRKADEAKDAGTVVEESKEKE